MGERPFHFGRFGGVARMTNDSWTDSGLLTSAQAGVGSSVVSDCGGTLPRCERLVCTGQEFDSWEGVSDTGDGVGLGDSCGTEGAHGMAETYSRVWNDSTSLKLTIQLLRAHQSALLPPSHQKV